MNNIADWFMVGLFIVFIIGVIAYAKYEVHIKFGKVKKRNLLDSAKFDDEDFKRLKGSR